MKKKEEAPDEDYDIDADIFDDGTSPVGFSNFKDEVNFRFVCLSYMHHILKLGAVEFRGGYWQTKYHQNPNGTTTSERTYVPDTREIFANAVSVWVDYLYPHLTVKRNRDYRVLVKKMMDQIEQNRINCLKKTVKEDTEVLSDEHYEGEDKITVQSYREKNLRLHKELFRLCSCFVADMSYFEIQPIIDGLD